MVIEDVFAGLEPLAPVVTLDGAQKRETFNREASEHKCIFARSGKRWMQNPNAEIR